jgi:glycosyltransferase involved in cell wall biosynthesis
MRTPARDERGSPTSRILMVGHEWFDDNPGGGGRYLADVARGLAARGHEITALVPRLDPATPAAAEIDGVAVRRFPMRGGAAAMIAGMARAVPAVVAERGPFDVVHSHFALAGLAPLWHPALARARRVCQFQGPWAGESAVEGAGRLSAAAKYGIERAAYARCDRFITLSEAFKDLLARDYGVDPARITAIPAGVDVDRFAPAPDRAALRAALGLGPGPVAFTMRRLVRRMGLEVLVAAWAKAVDALPDARLLVAGTGPLRAELEAQAEGLGLADRLRFLGRVSDEVAIAHYQAADLTVVPTLTLEGFGLITVESLACGTPVVGTTAGATPEILGPLDARLLVPPGDVEALAERLRTLLAEPGARPDREACRDHVLAHYTWPRVIARLEDVLAGG